MFEQDDRAGRRFQKAGFHLIHIAVLADLIQTAEHDGERFAVAVLRTAEPGYGFCIERVCDEVVAADALER